MPSSAPIRSVRFAAVLLVVLALAGCARDRVPVAAGGVLDLRGVDLSAEPVELRGEWISHPGVFLDPSRPEAAGPGRAVVLPGAWRKLSAGAGSPGATFATFRLSILLDTARVREVAFTGWENSSAYALWVDGRQVLGAGVPGRTPAEETPGYRHQRGVATPRGPRMEVVLVASNHYLDYLGPVFRFRVAAPERIETALGREVVPYLVAIGVLLVFAIQHLGFLAFSLRDRTSLLFGGFCLFWLVACCCIPAGFCFASQWFPSLPLQVFTVAAYCGVALAFACLTLFCEAMFPNPLLHRVNRAYVPFTGAVLAALLLGPWSWVYPVLGGLILIDYGIVAALTYSLVRAIRLRQSGAVSFAIGFGLFMGIALHDALLFFGLVEGSYIIQIGGTALAVAEAFVLSRRLTLAHRSNVALLTEVQAKNEELGRLSRLKDDFLANTSHELRTPLNGISGLVQAILADGRQALEPGTRRNLEHVVGSARRLARLINDILDFSRIRNRDVELRRGPVDLAALVPVLEPDFAPALRERGLELRVEVPAGLPAVDADPDRLIQILSNLVGNAVRFTDRGGVRVEARSAGDRVELTVSDTGVGIPADQIGRIFEPFEQVRGEYRGGTGLGLAVTRRLVALHGGTLSVESTPGEGSTFRFDLPVHVEGALSAGASLVRCAADASPPPRSAAAGVAFVPVAPPGERAAGAPGRTVLVVDDEPVNLLVVRQLLALRGIAVIETADGRETLDLVLRHRPALVLLDVMMPRRDGYEVCADLRGRFSPAELPVLFLSARGRPEDIVHGFAVGGCDYVLKPFLGEELLARVEAQLRQRELFDALRENHGLKVELAEAVVERRRLEEARDRLAALATGDGGNSSASGVSRLLVQKLGLCEERIAHLRERTEALVDDLQVDLPWGEAQSALAQLRELVTEASGEEDRLVLATEVMNAALALWTARTGKGKADLAEESGLWKVQVDPNGWRRPATLDKYLDPLRIPRLPKWKTIQKTVDFVVALAPDSPEALALGRKATRLQVLATVSPG